uniref:Uncharacterized protein n=1 Tax=Rhizophora mucronata TaxID=61149 RepID=A0A2P2IR29_RHIMU
MEINNKHAYQIKKLNMREIDIFTIMSTGWFNKRKTQITEVLTELYMRVRIAYRHK